MRHKKLLVVLCLVMTLIMSSFAGVHVVMAEEDTDEDLHYNIEVVVDASGSLKSTDPENNRFTAIDIFLQTLREKGNNAGSVVFTSEIQADTGLSEMNGKNPKENLSNQIKNAVPDYGNTNIGLALQTAVDKLKASNNGSQNIILLMSDGNTYMGSEDADRASLEIERKAVDQCVAEGIKVYGICLNKDGTANLDEFKNMTSKTSGAFLEVKTSENLVDALKDFYGQIFKTKFISDTKVITNGIATKSIEVPSYGVEELNITINNASKLTDVTITKPNGVDMTANEFGGISSRIGDYYFIKMTDPAAGLWVVTVKGEEGTEITFDFVFNANNSVGLETSSGDNTFSVNEEVAFSAGFYSKGQKLVGKEYYDHYKGTLVVNFADSKNENLQYYPMEADGENGFKASLSYDKEGTYEIYSVLTCGEFESQSEPIIVSIGNDIPVFKGGDKAEIVKITKLFNTKETIDLGKFFTDKETQNLSLSILSSSYGEKDITGPKGNKITLKKLVDGKITVQAEDEGGATVKGVIQVQVKDYTWIIFVVAGVLVVLIIGIIIYKKVQAGKIFFEGTLVIFSSSSEVDDTNSQPQSNIRVKCELADFGLRGHQFDKGMYFKVLPDKSEPGYASHKLQLVSPKTFYYLSPSGEVATKSLNMERGMTYDIRSSSQEDPDAIDDTITLSLDE